VPENQMFDLKDAILKVAVHVNLIEFDSYHRIPISNWSVFNYKFCNISWYMIALAFFKHGPHG